MKDSNIRAEIKRNLATSKDKSIITGSDHFDCVHDNFTSNQGCTSDNPLCKCPCATGGNDSDIATAVPLFREPTALEMSWAKKSIAPCSGGTGKYDGYLTLNPDAILSSCGVKCHGKHFHNVFKALRIYSTFWDTPKKTPLYRNALSGLMRAQKSSMTIPGNLAIKLGDFIYVPDDGSAASKEYSGAWLVSQIDHNVIGTQNYTMNLTLIRDSKINVPEFEGD